MSRYVVDASVVAKWVLAVEPYQPNALKLKFDHVARKTELFAPSIMLVEVANAVWKAVKLKRLSQQDAKEAVLALSNIGIFSCEVGWEHVSEVYDIASRLDASVYDAVYLFLACEIKAQFVTSDDRLFEKAERHFPVLHLKDYNVAP